MKGPDVRYVSEVLIDQGGPDVRQEVQIGEKGLNV